MKGRDTISGWKIKVSVCRLVNILMDGGYGHGECRVQG